MAFNITWLALTIIVFAVTIYFHVYDLRLIFRQRRAFKQRQSDNTSAKYLRSQVTNFAQLYYDLSPNIMSFVESEKNEFLQKAFRLFLSGTVKGKDLHKSIKKNAESLYQARIADVHLIEMTASRLPKIGWVLLMCNAIWLVGGVNSELSNLTISVAFTAVVLGLVYGQALQWLLIEPLCVKLTASAIDERTMNLKASAAFSALSKKNTSLDFIIDFESTDIDLDRGIQL